MIFRFNHPHRRADRLPGIVDTQIWRVSICCALLYVSASGWAYAAQPPKDPTATEADRATVAVLSRTGLQEPKVISDIDLTDPFRTVSKWRLLIVRENGPPPPQAASVEVHGPLTVCFLKDLVPRCERRFSWKISGQPRWFTTAYNLLEARVVHARGNRREPLLLLRMCGVLNANGNCGTATELYRYHRQSDRFVREFSNIKGRNNNPATRFVQRGPLRGDIIVDYPTAHAPYRYWIEVYRAGESGRYVRILRYRGHTGYADGNVLQVPDSEMAELFRRLGLWHRGDPPPLPAHPPAGCSRVVIRDQEEWCR